MAEEHPDAHYDLTDEDLEELEIEKRYWHPVIRAAANPDPRILKAILALKDPRYSPSAFDGNESAVTVAIRCGLPKNISLLLQDGADPNGMPRIRMSQWSARFMRFVHLSPSHHSTREVLSKQIARDQLGPYSEEEIKGRRKTRLPFWAGPMTQLSRLDSPCVTALEAAVSLENIDVIDALLDAGADTEAWINGHASIPEDASVSLLSPSTPLHRAIEIGNIDIVRHLLQRGFKADVFPLASLTRCLNPLMFSFTSKVNGLPIYELLCASASADHSLLTPVFGIHISHIVCATLSLESLRAVFDRISPDSVGATALGHTLLHIVCLPRDDNEINHFSSKIHESVHDIRCLDLADQAKTLWPYKPPGQFRSGKPQLSQKSPSELAQQWELITYLKVHGTNDWTAKDYNGNTPLHYLVSQRNLNEKTLRELLEGTKAEQAWAVQNIWGHSPQDLLEEGITAVEQMEREGKRPEDVVYMPHWRDPMGWWLGGQWKSHYPEDK